MSDGSEGYAWALLRVVPRVHLGDGVTVGVVVHAREAGFLRLRALTDPVELERRCRGVDAGRLGRYLEVLTEMAAGRGDAGPLALLPPSERFHWLVAPRSDVVQFSPVHEGVDESPSQALERIWNQCVAASATDA